MTINLYRVPNISRENTPHFTQRSQQGDYFANKLYKAIQASYYPPHYANTITVDSDDFEPNAGVNYLSLRFNNKDYYYFIDSIEYINEDLYALHVTMDVVQTYFFNITLGGLCDRRTIKRRIDNLINRNYIRENVSEGDFRVDKVTYLAGQGWSNLSKDDNIFGWFIIQASDKLYDVGDIVSASVSIPNSSEERRLNTSYYYYFIPMVDAASIQFYIDSGNGNVVGGLISETLHEVAKQARVTNIYFIPGQVLPSNAFTINHGNDTLTLTAIGRELFQADQWYGLRVVKPQTGNNILGLNILVKNEIYFSVYDATYQTWSPECEVCMIDENYYRIAFGEQSNQGTYPLYQMTNTVLSYSYWANVFDGTRFYQVHGNTDYRESPSIDNAIPFGIYPDPFCVTIAAATKSSVDLTTDPWIQWNEYNKSSIGMAFLGFAGNVVTRGATAQLGVNNNNADINAIMSNPNYRDKRFTTLQPSDRPLKTKWQNKVTGLERDNQAIRANQASSAASASGSLVGTATSYLNAWLAPDSPRQYGSFNSDVIGNSINQIAIIYRVTDFYKCAFYFHVNGNKVNEYMPLSATWYNSLRNRRDFDVIKFSDVDISMTSAGDPDTDVLMELRSRFLNGLRLWHYDSTQRDTRVPICDYTTPNLDF